MRRRHMLRGMGEDLERTADDQHGIFGRDTARLLGVTDRAIESRTRSGRYERVGPKTYRVVGASPTWRQSVMRAVTAAGDGSAASHRTALALHRILRPHPTIEVVTPRRRRLRLDGDAVVHTAVVLPTEDLRTITGIPTTSVPRSILDFAGTAPPDAVAHVVDNAIAADLTTAAALSDFLERRRRRGRRGVTALASALDRTFLGQPESRYERRLLDLLEQVGLSPVPQYVLRDGAGRFIARLDIAFPDQRLGIEVDGHAFHSTREQRAADAQRQNRIASIDWMLLRYTSDQVFLEGQAIAIEVVRLVRDRS